MLIGLTGLKQSGKSTAAEFLADRFAFEHTSFAAPMRRFTMDVLGMNELQLEVMKEQPLDLLDRLVTPRQFMQRLGTEFGREMIHPDLWVRSCINRINTKRPTVVSDVRFDNEAHAIKALGGKIVQIRRRGQQNLDLHPSEAGVHPSLVDYTLDNDGQDLRKFQDNIVALVRWLRHGEV
jgi:hypothetical protein